MKLLAVLLFALPFAQAQSHPQWWTYASPNATALVGIRWANLKSTFLAPDVRAEIGPGGSLHFPPLACLDNAEQILISAPDLFAMASGACPASELRAQAAALGWRASTHRGIQMWAAPEPEALSVALFADRLLFIGSVPVLREAIDRTFASERSYARLLARAAVYTNEDLWVVARRLPDALASRFVPLELRTLDFEASVSLWEGMHLVASMTNGGIRSAEDLAGSLQALLDEHPELIEGSEVTLDRANVYVKMDLTEEQMASLAPPARAVSVATPAPVSAPAPQPVAAAPPLPPPAAPKPASKPPEDPAKPKVIRIYGLGDQPKEVPLKKP